MGELITLEKASEILLNKLNKGAIPSDKWEHLQWKIYEWGCKAELKGIPSD
ncbi:hypothetical protein [Virgibacillus proomii]|uniref:hypothetical protein n=1 Tax=Virgibacillus proomii TaxID=84407 RepID=UPI001C110612|nr:hypothetical protein [Virgibacillus proomii]MBU5266281.1 hypothetical protein [Virgibacillus proomii]